MTRQMCIAGCRTQGTGRPVTATPHWASSLPSSHHGSMTHLGCQVPATLEAHAHVTALWREGDPGPAPTWGPPGTALACQAGLTGGQSLGRQALVL